MEQRKRHFKVFTRTHGTQSVSAQTARHAVAAIVARLGLDEKETAQVVRWAVTEERK